MAYKIKNISAFPLDVATTSGPAILPVGGEITVELDALNAEIWRQSPYGELSEGKAGKKADPLDHDKDGKKGGSTAPEQADELADLRAQYAELYGKRPFMGWDAKTLTAKIDEKLAE